MADNTTLNPGSGGDNIVTDPQPDGSKIQVVRVAYGPKASFTRVDTDTPLPTTDPAVLAELTSFITANHADLAALLAKLGSVTLDAATLAALEHISIDNFPADPATQTTLAAVLAKLNGSLAVNLPASTATVFVDAGTITAGTYRGITVKNTSTTATAEVAIRNQNVTGTILDTITLAGNESVRETYPAGRMAASGTIYMQLVAGAVSGSVFAS